MENMPVLGRPIGYMTVNVFFCELYKLHPSQYIFCLLACQKGHGPTRSIPLVMQAKELAYKNPAGF